MLRYNQNTAFVVVSVKILNKLNVSFLTPSLIVTMQLTNMETSLNETLLT